MIVCDGVKFRDGSVGAIIEVVNILARSEDKYRHRTSFKVNNEWYTERQFTYYAEKLIQAHLVECKCHRRGWYSWTTYRLKQSAPETFVKLWGIPF